MANIFKTVLMLKIKIKSFKKMNNFYLFFIDRKKRAPATGVIYKYITSIYTSIY